MSKKWIICSNRLPFSYNAGLGRFELSSGGLVTAISGIRAEVAQVWVGSVPETNDPTVAASLSERKDGTRTYHPVALNPDIYLDYYNGMCNNVLWPLLHYEGGLVDFSDKRWEAYCEVNEKFAEEVIAVAEEDDLIWVHDFHLFLAAKAIKRRNPRLKVGFFLHTPFPSSEIFRQLPVRREILSAVISADLVGFHDYSYLRHFCSSVRYVLGLDSDGFTISTENHTAQFGVFPVSIDTAHFQQQAASTEVKLNLKRFRRGQQVEKICLGVDRLDYIKGIALKMRAFGEMLDRYPDMRGRVSLIQIAVPSRTEVPNYVQLKYEVENLVGQINGKFGEPHYTPIQYLFTSIPFHELLALYQQADSLLVTSRRDGMNLVALEYIAAQKPSDPGVVVLSEFAGAISTLSHVVQVNPWDIPDTADKFYQALNMDLEERRRRQRLMLGYLEQYTATDWAASFMDSMESIEMPLTHDAAELLDPAVEEDFEKLVRDINHLPVVLFLDYDGTLVPIRESPELATLGEEERDALRRLAETDNLEVVIVSGRDRKFLSEQFRGIDVPMAAEHGSAVFDPSTQKWKSLVRNAKDRWYPLAQQIMEDYTSRVPGSFVEKKKYAIAWHYRRSPTEFGEYQARRLSIDLEAALHNLPTKILAGKKVIEARAVEVNKGAFVASFSESHPTYSAKTLVALGDDVTDEDMFSYLGKRKAVSIKVGGGPTCAKYRLQDRRDVYPLLSRIQQMAKGL